MFPINLSSTPISYGTSDILKVNVSFEYERYIAGKSTSISEKSGASNNRGSLNTQFRTDIDLGTAADIDTILDGRQFRQ
jgi:hypothetical protein